MTLEQRPQGNKGVNSVDIGGKGILDREKGKCKIPETWLEHSKGWSDRR